MLPASRFMLWREHRARERLPKLIQCSFCLVSQYLQLFSAAAQAIDNMSRRLGKKSFVTQLTLTVTDLFLDPLQFLLQTLALRANIDLALVDDAHVKASRAAGSRFFRQRMLGEADVVHIGKPLDRDSVVTDQLPDGGIGMNFNRCPGSRLDLHFGSQITHADDEILQNGHVLLGIKIDLLLAG